MNDIFTNEIKDLLKLVTADFDKFYKKTEKKSKSSGDSSKAASSGDYSKAASSGYYSKAASSGYYSTAASSGNSSTAASSGNSSTAASSGDSSKAASSGDSSTAASSGNSSTAASSGNYSKAASSGYYSTAASSGDSSTAASSGNSSTAASSGDYSKAASSGMNAACSALGYRAAVKGDLGNLIMCSEYDKNGKPLGGMASIIDGKILKANSWYIVEGGKWVEVDFTDGVFSRVVSSKNGVKKVRNDNGDELYIVSSGEFNAHGRTIKEAREALVYKTQSRDVSEYKNMPKDTVKTPKEWAAIYHVTTGACIAGCENFIKSKGKLKEKYTLSEIIEQTKGVYGYDRFIDVVGAA